MTSSCFDYALIRAVPRVERGEFVNVGVVVYCPDADFLGAAVHLDPTRLKALDPQTDVEMVAHGLDAIVDICAGALDAGPAARESARTRFGWLTAPRSTVLQCGPVHGGMTDDPKADLDRLMQRYVR